MKYGKKNHVNLNPLAYNICLLGESKIGKTTLVKEVCEKLAGEDGYLFLELGMERGADAIEGINYVNCPEWDMAYDDLTNSIGVADVIDDIVNNKTTDYQNLQVVVFDTYDQLITLAEDKSVALYNRANQDKKVSSINAAWGGYGRGEKKAIELMLGKMDELHRVGVATFIIGHVKTKDVTDVVSGETYQTLTSDQQQNYFNALKKNLHVLGLAYIDREIVREKTGKKDPNTKKEITIGKVTGEVRKIKFRDDTYCVDSGGRFASIVPEIPLDSDAFIKALNDAILAEQTKSGQTLEASKKEQREQAEALNKRIERNIQTKKTDDEIKAIVKDCIDFITQHRTDKPDIAMQIMALCAENGYKNPTEITDIQVAYKLKAFLEQQK